MNINDITITSLETINAFDVVTGAYLFTLDELQNATIQNTEEKTDITGKGGRKLSTLKRNKTATISGTNGMVSGGLIEAQTGGTFEKKITEVLWTDYLTIESNTATTIYKAIGTVGSEIEALYIRNSDGTLGIELTQATTAADGKFAYAPATKTLTFSGIDNGTEIVVYYKRNITADTITNDSETFSRKCVLYVDAMAEDKCANVYRIQFYFPKADFSGEFSIEMGENQTVHAFEAEGLAGGCIQGAGGTLWTYTIFGADAADAGADTSKLIGVQIYTPPTKTTYEAGETFDPTGMVVMASYTAGTASTSVALNPGAYTYTPNGALTTANTTITVSYTYNGVTKTATQAITVTAG